MEVKETFAEGLQREYRVVVPLTELEQKVTERLTELKTRVRMNGFRVGKVPLDHLKRIYGASAMKDVIEDAMHDANKSIVSNGNFALASDPQIDLFEDVSKIAEIVMGKADLTYSVKIEIMPTFELTDFRSIELEKPIADVSDEAVFKAIEIVAQQNPPYIDKEPGSTAENDDRVIVSFRGTIEGQPFEGGTSEALAIVLGSGDLIPGFEQQLIGMAVGDRRSIQITFPANYAVSELANKQADFDVIAKSLHQRGPIVIDDAFATSVGIENLDRLKDVVRERMKRDYETMSRLRLKRALLDALEARHTFELPRTLLDKEFTSVWRRTIAEMEKQQKSFADKDSEEAARIYYLRVAQRHMKLGMILAKIGELNAIVVSQHEIQNAINHQIRQNPSQEKQIREYYSDPRHIPDLQAPLFEEKVVNFLFDLVKITEKQVTEEDLTKRLPELDLPTQE